MSFIEAHSLLSMSFLVKEFISLGSLSHTCKMV